MPTPTISRALALLFVLAASPPVLEAIKLPTWPVTAPRLRSDTIRTGSPLLTDATLAVGVDSSRSYLVRGEQRRLFMTYVEETVAVPGGYVVTGRNVQPDGRVVSTDSVMVAAGTLAPVWHWARSRLGEKRVAYEQGRVVGSGTDSSGASRPLESALAAGSFDYSMASRIVNRLPLRAGYAAVIVTHDVERGTVYLPITVLGEEDVPVRGASVRAWKVQLRYGPTTALRWIGTRDRRDVLTRVTMPQGELLVEH